ncbi:MAG: amidohydrolase family protein [Phycisphaerales bacterium]|nr:amidohydrolase family protein [Phycisphaerales bacterium]
MWNHEHRTPRPSVPGGCRACWVVAVWLGVSGAVLGQPGPRPGGPPPPPPERVALTGGKIIPIVGVPIERGTVLIEHGRIVAVGAEVEIPYDARVFDLRGKVVLPGMINAHTWRGLDIPNEQRPVVPQLDAYDALDPSQLFFEDCLRLGHTVVHVIPANNTVIGGMGQVVRPIGLTVPEMTLDDGQFLKMSVTPRPGFDRMMQMALLRETFLELDDALAQLAERRYEEQLKEEEKEIEVGPAEARRRGLPLIRAEDLEDRYRNLVRLRGGRVRVDEQESATLLPPLGAFMYCGDAMDVAPAVEFARKHGFLERTVLVLGGETFKAIADVRNSGCDLVMPEELTYREVDPLTGHISETFVPRVFFDAGLKFALVPGQDDSFPERMLVYRAAQCVRHGIPRDVALRAITLHPAEVLGLGQRFGSIEPGKDAHLVVFSGDPLDFDSVVEQVFIQGIPAYDRAKDVRLQRLIAPRPATVEAPQTSAPTGPQTARTTRPVEETQPTPAPQEGSE